MGLKLSDLNPRWCSGPYRDANNTMQHPTFPVERRGMGIGFDCPVHRTHRLAIFFANPIDRLQPAADQNFLWTRTGEDFDSMTVSPSVDASAVKFGDDQQPCWHGHIEDGVIR